MYAVMSDATRSTMWQKRHVYVTELVGTYLHRPQRVDIDDVLASASSKRMFGPLLWWELVLGVPPMQ